MCPPTDKQGPGKLNVGDQLRLEGLANSRNGYNAVVNASQEAHTRHVDTNTQTPRTAAFVAAIHTHPPTHTHTVTPPLALSTSTLRPLFKVGEEEHRKKGGLAKGVKGVEVGTEG